MTDTLDVDAPVVPALEAVGVTKSFCTVQALRGCSFQAYPGEVTALVGDNGAGKSTLVKVMSGVYGADSGTLLVEGNEAHITSPQVASTLGIETVYQDLALAPDLDAARVEPAAVGVVHPLLEVQGGEAPRAVEAPAEPVVVALVPGVEGVVLERRIHAVGGGVYAVADGLGVPAAAALGPEHAKAVGIIHQQPGIARLTQLGEFHERRPVAIHAEHPVYGNQFVAGAGALQAGV